MLKTLKDILEEFNKMFYPQSFANEGDKIYWEEKSNWYAIKDFIQQAVRAYEKAVKVNKDPYVKEAFKEKRGWKDCNDVHKFKIKQFWGEERDQPNPLGDIHQYLKSETTSSNQPCPKCGNNAWEYQAIGKWGCKKCGETEE